ncbi:MAG: hypothetical protein IT198_00840 [Acidimicrobiia bacterium]|nr:hypothetical protein [Acidimicrobiia bacterium]
MRRILRPRNLFLAALLAVMGTAIVVWRRRPTEETAWSEIETDEAENVATVSRLETTPATSQEVEAAQAREAAATLQAGEPGAIAESVAAVERSDLRAALDLDTTESASTTSD